MKRQNLLWIVIPLALVALLLGTYLYTLPQAVERSRRSPCGLLGLQRHQPAQKPLSLSFLDLQGKPYPFHQLEGRLVLLNFWLTTCAPCLEELPSLLELASRYSHKGLVLVMVSTDKDAKTIQEFLEKVPRLKSLPPNAFILHDPKGKTANALGTEKYPETYLIQPDGTWGGRVIGARSWTSRGVTACLEQRLP